MTSIVFFGTTSLEPVVDWYVEAVGAAGWLEQPDRTVLQHDNASFGFCERESAGIDGIVTFVRDSRAGVDAAYETLSDRAESEPYVDDRYDSYQFFAPNPEGRTVEFQAFLHETFQTFLHETDPV